MATNNDRWFHINKLIGREGPFAGPDFTPDKEKVILSMQNKTIEHLSDTEILVGGLQSSCHWSGRSWM